MLKRDFGIWIKTQIDGSVSNYSAFKAGYDLCRAELEAVKADDTHQFVADEHYTWGCKVCGCSRGGTLLHYREG